MKSFWIQTLGCKVNATESDRIARHLAARGLRPVESASLADLRVVNTCSVTTSAGAQSRAAARKAVRLPLLGEAETSNPAKVLVTGCWATSDRTQAESLPGVDGVITHHDERPMEASLDEYLRRWGWGGAIRRVELPLFEPTGHSRGTSFSGSAEALRELSAVGAVTASGAVKVVGGRQTARQRAFVKIQDGCDAHCTYCIIPTLRPRLSSVPEGQVVAEVRGLVEAGHPEVVLTGIFMGAYGHPTALRRRRGEAGDPLARLVESICKGVPDLQRLRLSSLEPGDLTDDLLSVLTAHGQCVPHFHLPLQSGSDAILRRMNRQYTRGEFLALVDRLRSAFDRPALTTDVVAGFPGEDDGDWRDTLSVIDHAGFLHVHAFPFSPRPGTAAARWAEEFVPNAVAGTRVAEATARAARHSQRFRESFVGEQVEVVIEKGLTDAGDPHGRCERWFDVELPGVTAVPGETVRARVEAIDGDRTLGTMVG
jgi:threonylcarbamoyladenosine tRNA methylthiotransferase MtaB